MPTPQRPLITEASYPASYRAAEMSAIVRAVRGGQSLLVCGLGGSGKSHLLRFLTFHSALPDQIGAADVQRLYLDCNAVIADDAAGVFRALLLETGTDAASSASAPDMLAILRSTLAASMTPTTRFVIVLDRFERIPAAVQPAVLDGLRHVRDYLARRVSYVLGSRTPPPIAELSEEFDDLLAAPPTVWVGPLDHADADWNVRRVLDEMSAQADAATIDQIINLSGGYPRLLRAATLAWINEPSELRAETLLRDKQTARVCEAIWRDLPEGAQNAAQRLATGEAIALPAAHALRSYGLARETSGTATLTIPLLAAFIRGLGITPQLELTALELRLWEIMRERPNTLVSRDDLIDAIYGDNPGGVNDEALTALAARLRRKLAQANIGTLEATRGLGYRFVPQGE